MRAHPSDSPEHSETHMQQDTQQLMDLTDIFSDSEDNNPSDMESFGIDDVYGSDPDAEIVCTRPEIEEQHPSSDDQVCHVYLCNPFKLFTK
jgi:hypothetical protein